MAVWLKNKKSSEIWQTDWGESKGHSDQIWTKSATNALVYWVKFGPNLEV